jgi:hypothetical protein
MVDKDSKVEQQHRDLDGGDASRVDELVCNKELTVLSVLPASAIRVRTYSEDQRHVEDGLSDLVSSS